MITYIQKTNKNSFTLRYKKYKKLGSDLWGRIAFINKKNEFTTYMKSIAERDIKGRIRFLSKRRKKRIQKRFKLRRKVKLFQYSVLDKPKKFRRNKTTMRSRYRLLAKKVKLFYNLRSTQKSLRKLLVHRKFKRANPTYNTASFLETRLDVLLYRMNFTSSIKEGRSLIKKRQVHLMTPGKGFFTHTRAVLSFMQIPKFIFISLKNNILFQRKIFLRNIIYSWKLVSFPPKYLFVDYKMMIGTRLYNPQAKSVRYGFDKATLAAFEGAALYF